MLRWRIAFAALALVGVAVILCPGGLSAAEKRGNPATDRPVPVEADHAAKMRAGIELFKDHVRPVLVKNCLRCHGGDHTESEFDLATRDTLLSGGAEGGDQTVVPGNAAESRLYKLITHSAEPKMPEEAAKLSDADIAHVGRWIDLGAPYDAPLIDKSQPIKSWTEAVVPPDARSYWAFEPLRPTPLPAVKRSDWPRTPVDRFVLAALEKRGLHPNAAAAKRVLVRRAYFDLTGLPPTPAEIEAFETDDAADAYERMIDRLLASPHYGERWARHWLDVARFAESFGFEHDYDRKHAYHFRDFVIRALNADMPYDQFVRWQLAGDELKPDDPLAMMATGFLGAGVFPTQITANEVERTRYDALDDMASTTGSALLGLTVGCARCHDHKYDPLPQADYYRMLATFTTAVRSEIDLEVEPPMSPEAAAGLASRPAPKKTKVMVVSEGLKPIRLHTQGVDFFAKTHFLGRGDTNQKDGVAEQGFLQVLMRTDDGPRHWQIPKPKDGPTSLRRTALANWIVDSEHGAGHLAARVLVNRLWQHHFGRGIVATPNDFGRQGDPPTHPELLDFLAGRLIADGWRLKPLHKLIMTSAAYTQSSQYDAARAKLDVANVYLWRRTPTRLDAEVIRDTMLAVSGRLDRTMFGPGTLDEQSTRRSIYFTVKRSQLVPMMQLFDAPEALSSLGARTTTTVAPQALLLMNAAPVRQCAADFAKQLLPAAEQSLDAAIRRAYLAALGREPTQAERGDCAAFLESQIASYTAAKSAAARELAWTDLCQALLALNEFVYVE